MAEERKQISRIWLWLGAAALLVAVFFVARAMTRDNMPVHATAVSRAELVSTISTNGLVEPVHNFEFHSPLATTVRTINVQQGQFVHAGTLLMQLDDVNARARVATAESGLHSAQVNLEAVRQGGTLEERQSLASNISRARLDVAEAQRELKALQSLQAAGAAAAGEVASGRQRLTIAEDALQSLQARQQTRYAPSEIDRAQSAETDAQAALAAARSVLERTSIRANVDGTVFSIPVNRSDFVEEGKLLLQLANLSEMRVRAYFDEPEIGRLALGQKIRIVWDARPGQEWHGHISLLPSTVVTYGTRNVGEVLVAIDAEPSNANPRNSLLPDTHVTVTVTTASQPNSLTVPREALHSENGKSFVYRVVNGSLARTPVVIGAINLTQVAVQSGLTDGDLVATGSANGIPLEEGVSVKVIR